LQRIAEPSREALTRDLLEVHRRNSAFKKKRKKKSLKAVHPVGAREVPREEPATALASIAAKIDVESYTKDYLRLSQEHKRREKYRVYPTATRDTGPPPACCARCARRRVHRVFFPCEHGVCQSCADERALTHCPLCDGVISVVLDHTGREHEEYWQWVEEVGVLALCHAVLTQRLSLRFTSTVLPPLAQVKSSLSTSFIRSFFVQSKEAMRTAMADPDAASSGSSYGEDLASEESATESEAEPTSFSCWRFLLWRRASRVLASDGTVRSRAESAR
jgi:hypothetical protein